MSFDLAIWSSKHAIDAALAGEVYAALAEGIDPPEDAGLVASPSVAAFIEALGAKYPDLDSLSEADVDESPWASGFELSERHVLLSIRWSAPEDAILNIVRLASEHGLVLYDPQGEEVHLPPSLIHRRKRWQFWQR